MKLTSRSAVGAALLMSALGAGAADMPEMREGLWQLQIQSASNPGNKKDTSTFQLCRDHAYDKKARALALNMPGCTMTIKDLGGGRYASAGHCSSNGTSIETKSEIRLVGDSATHVESSTSYSPALYGMTSGTSIQDQKYLGPCPAGAKAGDRIGPDGKIQHRGR